MLIILGKVLIQFGAFSKEKNAENYREKKLKRNLKK